MLALFRLYADAILQKTFSQNDDLPTVLRPFFRFSQGQGNVMTRAAFAAPHTGKRCIH
ncbi:hypothetical protein DDI_2846 [Dickeya dianthicola RNS04.9]|nr:hypothetical protein DDI_2846 [Dickeya dianthicola RNS04.9]